MTLKKPKIPVPVAINDDSKCSEENEIMFIAASRYYGAVGNKKKQKELDKIIKAYDAYVESKMMTDWFEGDDEEEEYDFL